MLIPTIIFSQRIDRQLVTEQIHDSQSTNYFITVKIKWNFQIQKL